MKKNVAIVAGGYSSEFEVSLRSAENLYAFIDKERYNVYMVVINKDCWEVILDEQTTTYEQQYDDQDNYLKRQQNDNQGSHPCKQQNDDHSLPPRQHSHASSPIDMNDFSFRQGDKTIRFDFAYITIHGTPGEDGLLQGYFDIRKIPYSTCGAETSALTFNKYTCNHFLKSHGIIVPDSILIRHGEQVSPDAIVAKLGLPVFVKPNDSGSSFGVSKVKETSQIHQAVEKAFGEGSEVLIERFIPGIELTCGCYQIKDEITVLPVTEVVSENEFFDYGAKYNGEVSEITPARISDELTKKIQRETEKIYHLVGAKGIIRVDYIATSDEVPVLLEVNTTPGMTRTSFIPQQVQAAGLNMKDIITAIIENN